MPYAIVALSSASLTESGSGGAAGDEPARLLTPEMVRQLQGNHYPDPTPNPNPNPYQVRQLQGTDVDADTAQRVLDDTTQLGIKAAQADEQQRRAQEVRHGMTVQEEVAGLRDEFANTDKDDAGTMTTVMAVAMAGRAIRPSLDVRCSGDMGRCGRDMGRHGGNIREI